MRSRVRRGAERQTEVTDRLAKRFGKYALVAGVARRARDLRDRVDSTLEPSSGALINRAIAEIARGEVRVRVEKPEEEESD